MYLSGEELAQTNSSRARHLHQCYEAGGSLADINQFYWHTHPLLSELELVRSSPPSPPFPLTETLLFESRVTENFDFKKKFLHKIPMIKHGELICSCWGVQLVNHKSQRTPIHAFDWFNCQHLPRFEHSRVTCKIDAPQMGEIIRFYCFTSANWVNNSWIITYNENVVFAFIETLIFPKRIF